MTGPNSSDAPGRAIPVKSLHHYAYRCRDAEETRHFYEDILGLPLVVTVYHDNVPSTGEYHPYFHIFFRMADGSCIAFFDLLDGKQCVPDPETPSWVNHLALNVDSKETLIKMKQRLEAHRVEVLGVVDHGIFDSIYFFDPNGIRLELTFQTASPEHMAKLAADAHEALGQRGQMLLRHSERLKSGK